MLPKQEHTNTRLPTLTNKKYGNYSQRQREIINIFSLHFKTYWRRFFAYVSLLYQFNWFNGCTLHTSLCRDHTVETKLE